MKFWKFTGGFAAAGVIIPACFSIYWFVFKGHGTSLWLWPSSFMFMGLDSPTPAPASTVVFVYLVAILENAALYAILGVVLWSLTRLVQWVVRVVHVAPR